MFDASGALYGTAQQGGGDCAINPAGCGVAVQLTPQGAGSAWSETVMYAFTGPPDGAFPESTLVFDAAGNLYGVSDEGGTGFCTAGSLTVGCGTVFMLTPPAADGGAWGEAVIYSFSGKGDGILSGLGQRAPDVIFDAAGNLYGAANSGGAFGCGTIYRLSPPAQPGGAWQFSLLWVFDNDGLDACNPTGGLVFDGAGNLYGMSSAGGTSGNGAVFRLIPRKDGAWREQVIFDFGDRPRPGNVPFGTIAIDGSGTLYGQTMEGGRGGGGVVFSLAQPVNPHGKGQETVLHDLLGGSDGSQPTGIVIDPTTGGVFGATASGGNGDGTLYRLAPPLNGTHWREKVLWAFSGNDGATPLAAPVLGGDGRLYGTTQSGGVGCGDTGCGTVFKLRP